LYFCRVTQPLKTRETHGSALAYQKSPEQPLGELFQGIFSRGLVAAGSNYASVSLNNPIATYTFLRGCEKHHNEVQALHLLSGKNLTKS
jgi:hypothetical protein